MSLPLSISLRVSLLLLGMFQELFFKYIVLNFYRDTSSWQSSLLYSSMHVNFLTISGNQPVVSYLSVTASLSPGEMAFLNTVS